MFRANRRECAATQLRNLDRSSPQPLLERFHRTPEHPDSSSPVNVIVALARVNSPVTLRLRLSHPACTTRASSPRPCLAPFTAPLSPRLVTAPSHAQLSPTLTPMQKKSPLLDDGYDA